MARKATRTTYATEVIGGVEIQRLIVEGDRIPDHYQVKSGDAEGEADNPAIQGASMDSFADETAVEKADSSKK